MKRVIFLLITFLVSGTWSFSQVQLTSIKNSPTKFKIPIAQRTIPGQTGFFQEYGDLAVLMDSLGIPEGVMIDSLVYNQTSDTLKLYTSAGIFKTFIPISAGTVTSVGLTTGTSGTDVGVINSPVTGSGTITLNIPIASATNSGKLSSTDWSTFNNKIGSLNGLTTGTQTFSVTNNTSGFTINSSAGTHSFNLPYEENSTSFRLGYQSVRRDNSVSLGNNAMGSSGASANNNTAIGKDVLRLAGSTGTGGSNNVGIGFQSLYSNTTGLNNTCISNYSGYDITTGTNNTAIGTLSGFKLTTQSNNTFIGYEAGRQNTGSGNIFIGNQSGRNETESNRLYIENSDGSTPLIGGDFSTNKIGINTAFASIARTLTVTGEMRVTDLTTDTPISWVGADADGDFSTGSIGTGLQLSGGILSNTGDLSNTNEIQTLSWTSPNLSISSGNSVTLPVLPAGTSSHTLAYLGGSWTSSSFLKNNSSNTTSGNSKRVTINDDINGESWPLVVNTATKFLVNGKVQMNSTSGTAVTSIMGRNNDMEVGTVSVGNSLELNTGILGHKQVLGVLNRISSSALFSTTSTATKIDFNNAAVQVNTNANTTTDAIRTTISNYGAYEIICECQFSAGATATYNFGIYVNGALNGTLVKQISMITGTTTDVIITGYVSSLLPTDDVDIRVSTNSNTSNNTIGRCQLALKGI